MIQKQRGPLMSKSTCADFCFPEGCLEFLPMRFVCLFHVSIPFKQSLKYEILDEIGCCELGPPSIESFENFLSVLIDREVNDYQLQQLSCAALYGLPAAKTLVFTGSVKPFSGPL